jgi:hypothetical protein
VAFLSEFKVPFAICLCLLLSDGGRAASIEDPKEVEAPAAPFKLPEVRVSQPAGYDSDEAFSKWVDAESERLTSEAQRAENPAERAQHLLAAANHLLSYGAVREATGELLGLSVGDAKSATSSAVHDKVQTLLSDAESALAAASADDAGAARARIKLNTLRAFATAMRAALTSEGDSEESRRAAGSALAPLSEDPDESVAAAAGLWQAVLRSRESDPASALSILPMATADSKEGRELYEFFGKVLRCRLLGRQSPPAALALLLQIEEQCHRWFEGARERALAIRATAWVRLQVLETWGGKVEGTEASSWYRQTGEELIAEHFASENTLFPLAPAIPVLKEPPPRDDEAKEPQDETQDAADDEPDGPQ